MAAFGGEGANPSLSAMCSASRIASVWRSGGRRILSAACFLVASVAFSQSPQKRVFPLTANFFSWVDALPWGSEVEVVRVELRQKEGFWVLTLSPTFEERRKRNECERESRVICYLLSEDGSMHVLWEQKCCAAPVSDCGFLVDMCVQDGACATACGKGLQVFWPLPAQREERAYTWKYFFETLSAPSLFQLPPQARAKVFFHGVGEGKAVVDSVYIYFSDFASLEAKRRIIVAGNWERGPREGLAGMQGEEPKSGWGPVCQEKSCLEWLPEKGRSFLVYIAFAGGERGARYNSYSTFLVPRIGPNPTSDKVRIQLPGASGFEVWVYKGPEGSLVKQEKVVGSEVEVSLPEPGPYWVVIELGRKRWSKSIIRE